MADITDSTVRAPEFHDRLPLERLFPDPSNHRRGGLGDLESLTADIRREGVKSPIMATPHPKAPEGTLLIVFGHRRHAAATAAGLSAVRVLVEYGDNPAGGMTDDQIELARAKENLEREDLSAIEEAWIYQERHLRTGESDAQIAAFYGAIGTGAGKTQGHVTKRRALLRLTEKAQQAVGKGGADGGIGTGDGYLLSQLMVHKRGAEVVDDLLVRHLDGTLGVALKQAIADAKHELGIESQTVGRRGNQPTEPGREVEPTTTAPLARAVTPAGASGRDAASDGPGGEAPQRRVRAYNQRTAVVLRPKISGDTYRQIVDHHIHGGRSRPGFVHWLAGHIEEVVAEIVARSEAGSPADAEEEGESITPE